MTRTKPLVVDLYCGRGGWTNGFLAYGFRVIGIDLVKFDCYRGEFRQADVRLLDGADYAAAVLVVASPPCDEFALFDKPWFPWPAVPSLELVEAASRFARRANVPLILENVRAAQSFLGTAKAHYGSFYLWGDGVPALLPYTPGRSGRRKFKNASGCRPDLRAEIPFELATAVASVYADSLVLAGNVVSAQGGSGCLEVTL